GDPHEVVRERLGGALRDATGARATAREARRDDRRTEPLQRPRDVDPLPAGEREALARAVAMAGLEVRHRHRPVERGVQGDGDDHVKNPTKWWTVRPAYQRMR